MVKLKTGKRKTTISRTKIRAAIRSVMDASKTAKNIKKDTPGDSADTKSHETNMINKTK
jgi:hypothetical protein